jgi:hypothetical protein
LLQRGSDLIHAPVLADETGDPAVDGPRKDVRIGYFGQDQHSGLRIALTDYLRGPEGAGPVAGFEADQACVWPA